uniref:Ig-like domain-containing protein n=1 Tax=Gopherus evgoodei TaxID=1825980 RepID=A0A8C4W9Q8_9SAUR
PPSINTWVEDPCSGVYCIYCTLCIPHLACSLLPGAEAQEFQLLQPQGAVSGSAGETLTLTCSVTFKGSGNGRHLVYTDTGSFPRVTQADTGIYHCVKLRKNMTGPNEEFRAGAGTAVSVTTGASLSQVGDFLLLLSVRSQTGSCWKASTSVLTLSLPNHLLPGVTRRLIHFLVASMQVAMPDCCLWGGFQQDSLAGVQ